MPSNFNDLAPAAPAGSLNVKWATDGSGNDSAYVLPMVGDSGSGGTQGLVPAPPAGSAAAGDFLNAGGTWTAPAGTYTLPGATAGALGGVELNTDLGGTATAPNVVATHLTAPLPVVQGGSGLAYAPFDVPIFAPGVGTNNQKLLRIALARTVTFPASAANSFAVASAASTGTAVYTLKKNGTSFATVTYTTSAAGVFAQASDANFVPGDLLEVDGPATADATLADVGITLFGERTA
jgi:hypothetical protein